MEMTEVEVTGMKVTWMGTVWWDGGDEDGVTGRDVMGVGTWGQNPGGAEGMRSSKDADRR